MIRGELIACDMCEVHAARKHGLPQLQGWLCGARDGTPDGALDLCASCRKILLPPSWELCPACTDLLVPLLAPRRSR